MHIGIVGAGFTGTMLAVHLLREAKTGITISLIESGDAVGRGVAYGTDDSGHLLNVPAMNMSAFEDDPSHFVRWLETPGADVAHVGNSFISRRIFGDYVAAAFKDAVDQSAGKPRISIVPQAAKQLHADARPAVTLADGHRLDFDRVALCLGNFPARPVPGLSADARASGHYLNDPWHLQSLPEMTADDEILIVGSGLTMADAVQSLLRRGHRGTIHVVSRHGFLPLPHAPARTYQMPFPKGRLLDMLRAIRREVRQAEAAGYNWRDVMDALRTSTSTLWQGLSDNERRRFMRHLRSYWDIHRHRLPAPVAQDIANLLRAKQLQITAGRIQSMSWQGSAFHVDVRLRGESVTRRFNPAWIINCTGPQSDYRTIPDPLVRRAMDDGLIRPDPLDLGIDVTPANAVISVRGEASPNMVSLGPPTKGVFWEITAVPDIRAECQRVAKALLAS